MSGNHEAENLARELTPEQMSRLKYLVKNGSAESIHPVDAVLALCELCAVIGDFTGGVTAKGRAVAAAIPPQET